MTEVPKSEQSLDSRLDEALEMTFPASDPVAIVISRDEEDSAEEPADPLSSARR